MPRGFTVTETERQFTNPAAAELDQLTYDLVSEAILVRETVRVIRDEQKNLALNPLSISWADPGFWRLLRQIAANANRCIELIGEGD